VIAHPSSNNRSASSIMRCCTVDKSTPPFSIKATSLCNSRKLTALIKHKKPSRDDGHLRRGYKYVVAHRVIALCLVRESGKIGLGEQHGLEPSLPAQQQNFGVNLLCKLAGGSDNKCSKSGGLRFFQQSKHGQHKSCSFARACRGAGNHVPALQQAGNRLCMNQNGLENKTMQNDANCRRIMQISPSSACNCYNLHLNRGWFFPSHVLDVRQHPPLHRRIQLKNE
jgi:hypothetical protein